MRFFKNFVFFSKIVAVILFFFFTKIGLRYWFPGTYLISVMSLIPKIQKIRWLWNSRLHPHEESREKTACYFINRGEGIWFWSKYNAVFSVTLTSILGLDILWSDFEARSLLGCDSSCVVGNCRFFGKSTVLTISRSGYIVLIGFLHIRLQLYLFYYVVEYNLHGEGEMCIKI